jgi:molybdate transport system substrate-binding protein
MSRVTPRFRAFAIFCTLGLLCLACQDRQDDPTLQASGECLDRPVRMAIASSLRELSGFLIRPLAEQDPRILLEPIFGASSAHARQLSLGAPIDVFVSADASIVDELIVQGLVVPGSSLEFATGRLSLVARASWPHARIETSRKHHTLGSASVTDAVASSTTDKNAERIDRAGFAGLDADDIVRMAVPSRAVPLGRYARAWLTSQGLLERLNGKIVETENARATLAAVDAGLVDLAVVYRSDLRLAKTAITIGHIDPSEYPSIRYVAARTQRAPDCESIDRALAAWASPLLQDELARAGFIPAFALNTL